MSEMNEIIKRVSKAILECPNASDYETLVAKRAIEAMREPTDKMIIAASIIDTKDLEKDVWQAMIDEALK